jgi:hypothetical protein
MFKDRTTGALYVGQMRDGDREATAQEVTDWTESCKPLPPTPLEQIRALETQYADAQAKVTRQALLALALERAIASPEAQGLTPEEVHADLMSRDNGYRALFLLEQQVEAIRAE